MDNAAKKFCTVCGAEIYSEAVMCPHCGAMQDSIKIKHTTKVKQGRKGFLIAAAIIGGIYMIFVLLMFSGNTVFLNDQFSSIAVAHVIALAVAIAAEITAAVNNARGAALLAGIAFSIAAICWLIYAVLMILPIVFSWIGFASIPVETEVEV